MKHWMGKGLTGMRIFTSGSTHAEQETFFADEAAFPVWQYASDQGLSVCMQMRVVGLPLLETVRQAVSQGARSSSTISPARKPPTARRSPPPRRCGRCRNIRTSTLKLTHRPIEQSVKGQSTPAAFLGKAVSEFGAATDHAGARTSRPPSRRCRS